jgi:hypothetical protein
MSSFFVSPHIYMPTHAQAPLAFSGEPLLIGPVYVSGGGVGISGKGEVAGKEDRRVNRVQRMCTHICKCKNDTC